MEWYLLDPVFENRNRIYSRLSYRKLNDKSYSFTRNSHTINVIHENQDILLETKKIHYFDFNSTISEIAIESPLFSDINSFEIRPYSGISGSIRIGMQNGVNNFYFEINKKGCAREIKWGINDFERTYREDHNTLPDSRKFSKLTDRIYDDLWNGNGVLKFITNIKSEYMMVYFNNSLISFISKKTFFQENNIHNDDHPSWGNQYLMETNWSFYVSCSNIPYFDNFSTILEPHTDGYIRFNIKKSPFIVPSLQLQSLIQSENIIYVKEEECQKNPNLNLQFLYNNMRSLQCILPTHVMKFLEKSSRHNVETMSFWWYNSPPYKSDKVLNIGTYIGPSRSPYRSPFD